MSKIATLLFDVNLLNASSIVECAVFESTIKKFPCPFTSTSPIPAKRKPVTVS